MSTIAVHRNGDSRSCGATTVVGGQSFVYANGKLISVHDDPNSHGAGNLIAGSNNIFINGKRIIKVGDDASADNLCDDEGGEHCSPEATSGSPNVFVVS